MNKSERDIQIALARFFDSRANLVVPNVSWGLMPHECDVVVLTQAGYCIEVEIKISKADLKADLKKEHGHNPRGYDGANIHKLFFAMPDKMDTAECHALVPAKAGIIFVDEKGNCRTARPGEKNGFPKWEDRQRFALARLGAIRIWDLMRIARDRCDENKGMREEIKALEESIRAAKKVLDFA